MKQVFFIHDMDDLKSIIVRASGRHAKGCAFTDINNRYRINNVAV